MKKTQIAAAIAVVGLGALLVVEVVRSPQAGLWYAGPQTGEAETDQGENPDNPEVPPDQVEKYINAYKAMNAGTNVEQAATSQGLSVDEFRIIERKIERDDMMREHVRDALLKHAEKKTEKAGLAVPEASSKKGVQAKPEADTSDIPDSSPQ